MIERGSGRTSGLTDWRLMDLLSMWACIQDHDTAGHWKQVAGWRKVCDLARAHLGRLKEYRRGLAEAWPPATNAAAQAYLGELDDLIDKVQRTHDAAAANYDALAAATRAISSARTELKPLHDEYVEKLQQKRTYEATAADPKAAMGARVPDKPVTDADLERLNVQARNLMYGLSGELQQAQVMLQKPPVVRPPRDLGYPDAYDGPGTAPVIPAIIPVPLTPSPRSTPTPPAPAGKSVPTLSGIGPVLGEANQQLTAPPTNTSMINPKPLTPAPYPGAGLPPALPPTLGAGRNRWVGPPNEVSTSTQKSASVSNSRLPSPPQGSQLPPPGGVIGGAPVSGSSPQAGANSPRRVNPVGGVIGGGAAGTAPSGGAGSRPGSGRAGHLAGTQGMRIPGGIPGIFGNPVVNDTARRTPGPEESSHHWDPDQPWETSEGVSPVVLPPKEEGPIDPGPAIGLDR